MKCTHNFAFTHQEPNGEDRIIRHFKCRNCPKTRQRNVKKARYKATLRRKPSVVPKLSKTLQKGLKSKSRAIKPVSDKRKVQNAEYLRKRKAFLERRPYCEIEGCGKPATDVHHGAGKEGEWLLREEFWWPACRQCHDRVELNRAWAKEKGYLKLRLTTDQLKNQSP